MYVLTLHYENLGNGGFPNSVFSVSPAELRSGTNTKLFIVTYFYGPNKTIPSAFFKYGKQNPNINCNIFSVTMWNLG
jgi:hypothetical protein